MSRFPMRHAATRWILALVVIGCLLPAPRPISADEIILVGVPLVRKFPADWCPLPIALEFVSSGDHADIYVTANNYVFDGSEFFHAHQSIDNMVVVRDSIYALPQYILDNNDTSSPFHACYTYGGLPFTVPSIFEFDLINPADAPLFELFESPPVGWDLTQGAYYQTPGSAPLNPSNGTPVFGIGSLGLGQASPTPSLADSARTSIRVHGLIGSKAYVLTGWWIADASAINVPDQVSLTIKIIGPDLVPLAQKTWGNLKARYR
jgi:hypothetical protein